MDSKHVDTIGLRLDHPELVPLEQQHLIADDLQRVKRILEWPVSGKVLDVGCSDGAVTNRIRHAWPQAEVYGCDIREDAALQWDVRLPYPYKNICAPPPFFDVAYCCEVFEHMSLHEATLALRNICAVLKPGGDLIVTVPNRDCLSLYEETNRARWRFPDHWSIWDYDSLSDFLLPHFDHVEFKSLYDDERDDQSIWLMVRARERI